MAVFWYVVPCSLEETDRCFGDACSFHYQGETDQRNVPEDSHLGSVFFVNIIFRPIASFNGTDVEARYVSFRKLFIF
jgi:hypothetical protein